MIFQSFFSAILSFDFHKRFSLNFQLFMSFRSFQVFWKFSFHSFLCRCSKIRLNFFVFSICFFVVQSPFSLSNDVSLFQCLFLLYLFQFSTDFSICKRRPQELSPHAEISNKLQLPVLILSHCCRWLHELSPHAGISTVPMSFYHHFRCLRCPFPALFQLRCRFVDDQNRCDRYFSDFILWLDDYVLCSSRARLVFYFNSLRPACLTKFNVFARATWLDYSIDRLKTKKKGHDMTCLNCYIPFPRII